MIGNAEFVFDVYGKQIPYKSSENEYYDFWDKIYQKIKDEDCFSDRNNNYLYKLQRKQELSEKIRKFLNNEFEENRNNDSELTNDSNDELFL